MLGLVGGGVFVPRTSIAAHGQVPHVCGRVLSTSVGHKVYGEEEESYLDTGDGGNVLACTGDYNKLDGGADCDDITCNGKKCYVDVRFGARDATVNFIIIIFISAS